MIDTITLSAASAKGAGRRLVERERLGTQFGLYAKSSIPNRVNCASLGESVGPWASRVEIERNEIRSRHLSNSVAFVGKSVAAQHAG